VLKSNGLRSYLGWTLSGLAGVMTLAACASGPPPLNGPSLPPPPPAPPSVAPSGIVINTPFRAEDFGWSTAPGTAHIKGLTAAGHSCAGNAVALTPDTPYSRERIMKLYGSADYAVIPTDVVRSKVITNDNPAVRGFVRGARCDAGGNFAFDNIPAGSFFIIAEVTDPTGPKVVMRRVTAVMGRVLQVPLTGATPAPRRTVRKKAQ
jgi:hypothetical protein